jgi:hypothetical protein
MVLLLVSCRMPPSVPHSGRGEPAEAVGLEGDRQRAVAGTGDVVVAEQVVEALDAVGR